MTGIWLWLTLGAAAHAAAGCFNLLSQDPNCNPIGMPDEAPVDLMNPICGIARRRARKLTLRPEAGGDGKDSWADLLRRVFAKDVFQCPECRKPMRLRAINKGPPASVAIVASLLRSTGPP